MNNDPRRISTDSAYAGGPPVGQGKHNGTEPTPEELAAQLAAVESQEKALTPVSAESPEQRIAKLEVDNARLSQVISRAIEARNSAVAFTNRWSDPSRLPMLIDDLRKSHPDIQKIAKETSPTVADQAASIMARIAVSYQLEALIHGMIYAWVDNGKLIVEIGIRGYRQMLMQRGIDWQTPRPMTEEERKLHGLKPDDHGAICMVFDWAREERFKARGQVADPIIGVGVWRVLNVRGKPDNIPAGRSAQWVAEKNAHKDAARSILPMPVFDVANIQKADFDASYDSDSGVWEIPAKRADWLNQPDVVEKFEIFLAANGVTGDELNTYLGHDWHYTDLDRDAMRAKAQELIAQKKAAQESAPAEVETPAEPVKTDDALTQDDPIASESTEKVEFVADEKPYTQADIEPLIDLLVKIQPDLKGNRFHAGGRILRSFGVKRHEDVVGLNLTRAQIMEKIDQHMAEKNTLK